eukprot:scpid89579/ scgid3857/ 
MSTHMAHALLFGLMLFCLVCGVAMLLCAPETTQDITGFSPQLLNLMKRRADSGYDSKHNEETFPAKAHLLARKCVVILITYVNQCIVGVGMATVAECSPCAGNPGHRSPNGGLKSDKKEYNQNFIMQYSEA